MMTKMVRMVNTMRRIVFNLKKRPDALIAVQTLSKADFDSIMEPEENLVLDSTMETPTQHA